MHTNVKSIAASVIAIAVAVIPGVGDAIHEAGGPEAVAAAVGVIATAAHALIHQFAGSANE